MARNSEDRQETINGTGELEVIQYGGKWLKQIPHEEAFQIRCDIPMYLRHRVERECELRVDDISPEEYRNKYKLGSDSPANNVDDWWWTDFVWYVEVIDPTREEYVVND